MAAGDKAYFARVSRNYARFSGWTTSPDLISAELRALRAFSAENLDVLDAGCGTVEWLRRVEAATVYPRSRLVAVDMSFAMLTSGDMAGSRCSRIAGDIVRLPFRDGSIDRVICRQSLHYVKLERASDELGRVLRAGGLVHSTQQVDHDEVPDEWYEAWSTLRGAPSRQRLSDARLSATIQRHGFVEVNREYVPLVLRYSWADLREKYGEASELQKIIAFFRETETSTRNAFSMMVNEDGVQYASRFRISTFQIAK